jgi:hypothetical protein
MCLKIFFIYLQNKKLHKVMYAPHVKLLFHTQKNTNKYCLHPVTSECLSQISSDTEQCIPCIPPPFTIPITDRIAMEYNGSKIPSAVEGAGGY